MASNHFTILNLATGANMEFSSKYKFHQILDVILFLPLYQGSNSLCLAGDTAIQQIVPYKQDFVLRCITYGATHLFPRAEGGGYVDIFTPEYKGIQASTIARFSLNVMLEKGSMLSAFAFEREPDDSRGLLFYCKQVQDAE